MHPTARYDLMQARVADMHHEAQRDALARAAREARPARKHQSGRFVFTFPAIAARRVFTALAGARI
jgi:hypothetical protein